MYPRIPAFQRALPKASGQEVSFHFPTLHTHIHTSIRTINQPKILTKINAVDILCDNLQRKIERYSATQGFNRNDAFTREEQIDRIDGNLLLTMRVTFRRFPNNADFRLRCKNTFKMMENTCRRWDERGRRWVMLEASLNEPDAMLWLHYRNM